MLITVLDIIQDMGSSLYSCIRTHLFQDTPLIPSFIVSMKFLLCPNSTQSTVRKHKCDDRQRTGQLHATSEFQALERMHSKWTLREVKTNNRSHFQTAA